MRIILRNFTFIALTVLLVFVFLVRESQILKYNNEIKKSRGDIIQLESDINNLNSEINQILSLKNLEELARGMNMSEPEPYQIINIDIPNSSYAEIHSIEENGVLDFVTGSFKKLVDYLR